MSRLLWDLGAIIVLSAPAAIVAIAIAQRINRWRASE